MKPIYGEIRTFFGRALIGRTVRVDFGKQGIFKGSIVNYDPNREKEEYKVHFVDDDNLYYDELTIVQCLRGDTFCSCKKKFLDEDACSF